MASTSQSSRIRGYVGSPARISVSREALCMVIIWIVSWQTWACKVDHTRLQTDAPARNLFLRGDAFLSNPQAMTVVGDFLALGDASDSMLKIFDRKSARLVASAGRSGGGPGEFGQIWSLQAHSSPGDPSTVWAFDARHLRLTGYQLGRDKHLRYVGSEIVPRVPGRPVSLKWISESSLVAVGFFERGRYFLIDRSGRAIRADGEVPLARDGVPAIVAQQALQPTVAVRPGGSSLAIAARYAARVDIYDVSDGSLVSARVPIAFEPVFGGAAGEPVTRFVSDQTTRFGYVSITATRDRVYALFSGRTRAEYPGRANVGQQVHIFGWDGAYLGALPLGTDIIEIAVDSIGTVLYGRAVDPEPAVYAYQLTHIRSVGHLPPVGPSAQVR